jgi:anti-sigma-K factor RskA
VISHEEASELLGAYALDAVDGHELIDVEEHLSTCPRCQSELDGLREVAGALGNSVETPPEGLWSGIVAQLPERQPPDVVPPMPQLGGESRSPFRAASSGPSVSSQRARRGVVATIGAIAIAVAAVAAVLGIGLVRANDRVSNLQQAAAHQTGATVAAALQTPGHKVVDLDSSVTHQQLAEFVVVPDGRGFLVSSHMPALKGDDIYQLWGIVGSQPISLGLLGRDPTAATFTMAGSVQPTRLSITAEPAGGSVIPSGAVIATGTV